MSETRLYPGVEIELGLTKYTMPPCGLDILIKHGNFMRDVSTGAIQPDPFNPEHSKAMGEVVLESLQLNYPELKHKDVFPHLNLLNLSNLYILAQVQTFPEPPKELTSDAPKEGETSGESTGAALKPT